MGRVHFGPATGEGLGRVTVEGAAADGIQVFLEGRYFGRAPMTIYSVPKGDYIIEGHYPDGRQVSKPVSVGENEESTVDLAGGKMPGATAGSAGLLGGEISPERLQVTKILLIAGAATLAFGITFGILESKAESDYQNAPNDQATLDSIATRGRRDALLANVGFVLTGACLIGAVVAGYPMLVKPEKSQTTALMLVPVAGGRGQMNGGSLLMRF